MSDATTPAPPTLVLGPLLRHVSETTATIFVETDRPCTVTVLGCSTRTFTVRRHHYALVIVEGLQPASTTLYTVTLDDTVVWPPRDAPISLPPSSIRTHGHDRPVRILFGSCRTAAPHEPPWSLELALDDRGRGVDALWAHAHRMVEQDPDDWPDLLMFTGDQVYADDTSPGTRAHIERRREEGEDLDSDLVLDFDEYCWLYHESWRPAYERWLMSVVPSVMIFDDHDMIDDWNISDSWVRGIRTEPWWSEHVIGGIVSYWIYQHLGNMSPQQIRDEGLLDAVLDAGDAEPILERWAQESERFTPVPGGYRFSYVRDLDDVRVVVIDARNGRVLEPGARQMVDDGEWAWIVEQCSRQVRHLVIVSSLPVFVPGALHDLQVWNEAVCDGAWTRLFRGTGEKIRRALDLEDWPAFSRSFHALTDLIADIGSGRNGTAPASITVVSGDIHFSFLAPVSFPDGDGVTSAVTQVTCSPLRNALVPHERSVMRFAMSRVGSVIGWVLRLSVRRRRARCAWELDGPPVFANCIGMLTFRGDNADVVIEQATMDDDAPVLREAITRHLSGTSREAPGALGEPVHPPFEHTRPGVTAESER